MPPQFNEINTKPARRDRKRQKETERDRLLRDGGRFRTEKQVLAVGGTNEFYSLSFNIRF